jgi:transposase
VLRASASCRSAYAEIKEAVRESRVVVPDETGWRVGGKLVWFHTWASESATCNAIVDNRSASALEALLGIDFDGVLVHDGWSSYNRFEDAIHQQCVAHVMRRCHELALTQLGVSRQFPRLVIELFKKSLSLRDGWRGGTVSLDERLRWYEEYEDRLYALSRVKRRNELNVRLSNHLSCHRGSWFVFLMDDRYPATNWQAEHAIRATVVNRKVWGGNRTWVGARAQAVLSSVMRTCYQQGRSAIEFLSATLRASTNSQISTPRLILPR